MSNLWSPIQFQRTDGCAPVVLVCEHASAHIPRDFSDLGLRDDVRKSHAVWDIGALKMARALSVNLDAPLVSCGVSRSIYDCNRPFSAKDCIPVKSEEIAFPGNEALTPPQRATRRRLIHDLFHFAVSQLIDNQTEQTGEPVTVVTLHSFTPFYYGQKRDVEIGFLHHENPALSEAACQIEQANGRYNAALNEPYDVDDGVTYSISRHADANRLHSTMIEVRNDLINSDSSADEMGKHLAVTLQKALAQIKTTRAA